MQRGELVQWSAARGFGFILADDGHRYFVHITNIARIAKRPRIGDRVAFSAQTSRDGRLEARSVSIQGANPKHVASQMRRETKTLAGLTWRMPLALVMAVLLITGLLLGRFPAPLAGLYAVMGLMSCLAYGADKRFAERGQWRISEATLLGMDLCFGVLGGLLGQDLYRHKTRKLGYVATTLLISGVHCLWLGGFALGLIDPSALGDFVAELMAILR